MQDPSIGRIVIYRSRVGGYDLPAIITATRETLHAEGVQRYRETGGQEGVPPLSSQDHVHLTVFSPGVPTNPEPPKPLDVNAGGSYREWDVPLFEAAVVVSPTPGVPAVPSEPSPGTWRWPERR